MNLRQLTYFLEAAKYAHIGKAAEMLSISPSAISHSIAALEYEFGKDIFIKEGKNIRITPFGKIMLEKAEMVVATAKKMRDDLLLDNIDFQSSYSFAASHVLCEHFLTPVWSGIQKNNPVLKGKIYSLRSADIVHKVAKKEIDLGICFSPQSSTSFNEEILHEGSLIIAIRKDHPLLNFDISERIKRLSNFPAIVPISFQGVTNCESHSIFRKCGIELNGCLFYDHYGVAVSAIVNSDGWSLIPDILLKIFPNLLVDIGLEYNAPVKISAIWPKDRVMTSLVNNMLIDLTKVLSAKYLGN